jgi:hypothetical protein
MVPGPQAPFVDPAVSVLARGRIGPAATYLQARRAALSFFERNYRAAIPINGRIGGGVLLVHPNGIVIDPDVVIGTNRTIFQQVTIGDARHTGQEGSPSRSLATTSRSGRERRFLVAFASVIGQKSALMPWFYKTFRPALLQWGFRPESSVSHALPR